MPSRIAAKRRFSLVSRYQIFPIDVTWLLLAAFKADVSSDQVADIETINNNFIFRGQVIFTDGVLLRPDSLRIPFLLPVSRH